MKLKTLTLCATAATLAGVIGVSAFQALERSQAEAQRVAWEAKRLQTVQKWARAAAECLAPRLNDKALTEVAAQLEGSQWTTWAKTHASCLTGDDVQPGTDCSAPGSSDYGRFPFTVRDPGPSWYRVATAPIQALLESCGATAPFFVGSPNDTSLQFQAFRDSIAAYPRYQSIAIVLRETESEIKLTYERASEEREKRAIAAKAVQKERLIESVTK